MPDDIEIDDRRPTVFGIVLGAGFWPVLYGALMWWVPVAIWIFGGLWALSRLWLGYISKTYTFWVAVAWSGAVIFWPILGVLVFTVFGFRERPVAFRLITVLGGGLAWIVITAVALFVGDVL
jgi:hypothetical protein